MVFLLFRRHVAIPELATLEIFHARFWHPPAGILVSAVVQHDLLGGGCGGKMRNNFSDANAFSTNQVLHGISSKICLIEATFPHQSSILTCW